MNISNDDDNGADRSSHSHSSNRSGESEILCNACGFESSYVPEGMMDCGRCHSVYYCSLHCLKWDWNSGGHAKICVDRRVEPEVESVSSHSGKFADDGSVVSMDADNVFGAESVGVETEASSTATERSTETATSKSNNPGGDKVKAKKAMFEGNKTDEGKKPKKPKLGSFFKNESSPNKKGLKHQSGPIPGHPALYQQDLYRQDDYGDRYRGSREDEEDNSDHSEEQSIQMMSKDSTLEEDLLQSIQEEAEASEEPDLQGSWRSRDHFDLPSESSHHEGLLDEECIKEVFPEEEYGYGKEEYVGEDAEEVGEEYAEVSEESYASDDGERGIFVAAGAQKRDDLSLSPEHSIESARSAKRTKEKMEAETTADPSTSRVISPENSSGDVQEDSTETAPVVATVETTVPSKPDLSRNESGDSVMSAAFSLKEFHNAYSSASKHESGKKRGSAEKLMDFRDIYRTEDIPQKEMKAPRRASMQEMAPKQALTSSKSRRRMSLEDQLDHISQASSSSLSTVKRATTSENSRQPEVSENLKKSVSKALRDYETMYGKAATDEAIMQLTNGIEKEHEKQKADRRHEEILDSSWGPASVGGGMSDCTSMLDSFAEGSTGQGNALPKHSYLDSQMSVESADSEEDDRRMLSGGHLVGTPTATSTGHRQLSPVVESSDASNGPGASSGSSTGGESGSAPPVPRYMQYRTSLARSSDTGKSSDVPNKTTGRQPTEEQASEEKDESESNLLVAGAGIAVAAGALTVGTSGSDTPGAAQVAASPSAAPSDSQPRYMKYRTSLAKATEGTQLVELSHSVAEDTSQPKTGVATAEAVSEKAADQGSSEDNDESKSKALLVGAGVAVAAGAVTAGIMTGTLELGENTSTPGGTPSASIPRYMQYRSSLAKSTGGTEHAATDRPVIKETSQGENGSDSVKVADQGSSEDNDESKSKALLVGAGVAVAAGAVTAGIMTGTSESGENTSTPGGTPSASIPRYMQYRSSLAKSTGDTEQAAIGSPVIKETSQVEKGFDSVETADQGSSEDNDESKSNALLVGAGVAVAAGAVTAGIMAGSSESGESTSTPSGTPSGSIPRYMQYRTSLARSTDASTRGDQADKTSQLSRAPTDNETPSVVESSGGSDTGESGSSFSSTEGGFNSKAVLVGAGIATAGAATAGVLSGTSDGAKAAPSAEQAPADDAMTRYLAYQASIAETMTENERLQEVDEAVATVESSKTKESVDATGRVKDISVVPPSILKATNASGDEKDPDRGVGGTGSDGDQDDIETGVTEEVTKALPSPGGHGFTRRRKEYLVLFVIALAVAFGIGFGVNRSSDDNDTNGNMPTLSPVVITASPTQLTVTDPSVAAPTRAPATGQPVSAVPTTLTPTAVVETETPTATPTQVSATEVPVSAPTAVPTTLTPTLVVETATPTSPPSTEIPTISPTTSSTDQDLLDLLVAVSFDNGTSILTQGTPQNFAFQWLASSANLDTLPENRKIQRYALATFFKSTDGDSWTNSVAWLSEVDECSWYSRSIQRPNCNAAGDYVNLVLGFNGVSGIIPPEIALLSELTLIDLSGGTPLTLTGSLPSELGLLTLLQSFSAQRNSLTGFLPPEIGAWTALAQLDLSENKFSGPLPSDIGSLTALTALNLTTNEFTGDLPTTFAQIVGLQLLSLADNAFEGSVPPQLGLLAQLQTLSLETNNITEIPTELGLLRNLTSLTLFENNLTGTLHTELGAISSLRTLNMRSNRFTGPIPPQYGSLTNLRGLDLSSNNLNGLIPVEIGQLIRLFALYLQSNRLSGQIPIDLGFLTRVTEIRVDDNDLTGTVPDTLCDTFASTLPAFYLDCNGQPPEIACPPGTCCTYCCEDGVGCDCVYGPGSPFEFLC
jgi:hypothetical protein